MLSEQVVKSRLEKDLVLKEGISERQYGFKKRRPAPLAVKEVMNRVKST